MKTLYKYIKFTVMYTIKYFLIYLPTVRYLVILFFIFINLDRYKYSYIYFNTQYINLYIDIVNLVSFIIFVRRTLLNLYRENQGLWDLALHTRLCLQPNQSLFTGLLILPLNLSIENSIQRFHDPVNRTSFHLGTSV